MLGTLLGCRTVEHNLYKDIEMPLFEGALKIGVSATPKDYDVNNKRLTKYAEPYSLDFRFYTNKSEILSGLRVTDISLEGKKTGIVISLSPREKKYSGSKRAYESESIKSIFVMVGYEEETQKWSYEPYTLRAKIEVYRNGTYFDEQNIEVLLEPNPKKSKRSDAFDSFMSR